MYLTVPVAIASIVQFVPTVTAGGVEASRADGAAFCRPRHRHVRGKLLRFSLRRFADVGVMVIGEVTVTLAVALPLPLVALAVTVHVVLG